jgi:two-component system, OmpR family, sensor histidine kinase KdpD
MADMSKPTEERILVCVSPSPSSAQLISRANKMATSLHAKWSAVYVEQPKMAMLPEAERSRAADNLRLAGQLGAETVTLAGRNVAEEIIDFARQRRVTRLIVGKPTRPFWRSILSGSPVDRLVRISRDIDVYVTTGQPVEKREPPYVIRPERLHLSDYGAVVVFLVLATLTCFVMYPYFNLSNLIMVYLLGVMLTATSAGRGPAVLMSFLSVLAFDFFFVPPRFSFNVEESEYIVTFGVMVLVALVISHLAAGMREQTAIARLQERQAAAMHGLSRQLASARGVETILELAVRFISEIFDCEVSALLPDEGGKLRVAAGDLSSVIQKNITNELHVAHAAYDSGEMAGWGTRISPTTDVLYVPLRAAATTFAILALRPRDPGRFLLREQLTLLESLAKQVALALEVERIFLHALAGQPRKVF